MDTTSLIIGSIVLVICLIPIILFNYNSSVKQKIRYENLIQKAKENDAIIHEKDSWNATIIGIDKRNKLLFFSKKSDEFDKFISINISDLLNCRIERTENNDKVLEKLELELTFASKPTIVLEFFDKNETRLIVNEIEMIQKWQNLLNKII